MEVGVAGGFSGEVDGGGLPRKESSDVTSGSEGAEGGPGSNKENMVCGEERQSHGKERWHWEVSSVCAGERETLT